MAPGRIDGADLPHAPNYTAGESEIWEQSPSRLLHAANAIMRSYVLAPAQNPGDQQWPNMPAEYARIGPIEHVFCRGIRSQGPFCARITEAESLDRKERMAQSIGAHTANLSGVTYEESKDSRYPPASECALETLPPKMGGPDWHSSTSAPLRAAQTRVLGSVRRWTMAVTPIFILLGDSNGNPSELHGREEWRATHPNYAAGRCGGACSLEVYVSELASYVRRPISSTTVLGHAPLPGGPPTKRAPPIRVE